MPTRVLSRSSRRGRALKGLSATAWEAACDQLGLKLKRNNSWANGRLGNHPVTISLVGEGDEVQTRFEIAFEGPRNLTFSLSRSAPADMRISPLVGASFEDVVAIDAEDRDAVLTYLTRERRVHVLDTFQRLPNAVVENQRAACSTPGMASDPAEMIAALEQLFCLAEASLPCWIEMPLDEGSVLDDLFNASREVDDITTRFGDLYQANEVHWTGEIVQVGAVEKHGRRIVVLVGSSAGSAWSGKVDSGTMWGGRVVAMTLIDRDEDVERGDVVTFDGALRHLDAKRRTFRIEHYGAWKPRRSILG